MLRVLGVVLCLASFFGFCVALANEQSFTYGQGTLCAIVIIVTMSVGVVLATGAPYEPTTDHPPSTSGN
jgi:hypothetical protein